MITLNSRFISKSITNLYIKTVFLIILCCIIHNKIMGQGPSDGQFREIYVEEAIITDRNLKTVLENSIIPIAKAHNYKAQCDVIEIYSKEEIDSLTNEKYEDIIIFITANGLWNEYISSADSEDYQATINGVRFLITGNRNASWFKTTNKKIYLGKIRPIELWMTNDNFITLIFKKYKDYFRLNDVCDYGCSWFENGELGDYGLSLPIRKLENYEMNIPSIDTNIDTNIDTCIIDNIHLYHQ